MIRAQIHAICVLVLIAAMTVSSVAAAERSDKEPATSEPAAPTELTTPSQLPRPIVDSEPTRKAFAVGSLPGAAEGSPTENLGSPDNPVPGPEPKGRAASLLQGVNLDALAGGTEVTLQGDGPFRYRSFELEDLGRFVVDLVGVTATPPSFAVPSETGPIERVRAAQFRAEPEPITRVVVDLRSPAAPVLEPQPDGLEIFFAGDESEDNEGDPEAVTDYAESGTAPAPKVTEEAFDPAPLQVARAAGPSASTHASPADDSDALFANLAQGRRLAAERTPIGPLDPQDSDVDEAVRTWQETGEAPVIQRSTTVLYPFGQKQVMLTCSPDRVCDIELQAGEVIYDVAVGASDRWTVQPLTSGDPEQPTPHVLVQPAVHGTATNLVIGTNERVYHVGLHSPTVEQLQARNVHYDRHLKFYYPDETVKTWNTAAQMRELLARRNAEREKLRSNDMELATSLDSLNLSYSVDANRRARRKVRWVPTAVFDDGVRTYIKFPRDASTTSLPTLVIEDGDKSIVPNSHYEPETRTLVVHRLFDEALLFQDTGRRRPEVEIRAIR